MILLMRKDDFFSCGEDNDVIWVGEVEHEELSTVCSKSCYNL